MIKKLLLSVVLLTMSIAALASHHSVTVYYEPYCGACHDLMGKLSHLGIPYSARISNGRFPFVPVLVVDGRSYIGDQSYGTLERILN